MPGVGVRRVVTVPWFIYLAGVMGVVGVVVGVAVGIYLIRKYRERKWGYCRSARRLDGKVVVVTGANSGIGKEAARELAARGALVVLACRNKEAALEAVKEIRTTTADGELIVMELDLGELASIRTFSSSLLGKFDRLDVLVNNAGVYVPPEDQAKTKDGIEIHFGVNHLGHFLLTHLLLPRLQDTPGSRVVTVSSSLYKSGKIDLDDLESKNGWDRSVRNSLYSNSKLANIMHSQELARRTAGTNVRVFALCPGFVSTGLFRYSAHRLGFLRKILFAPVLLFFMRTARQGAQSTIYCAVSEELDDKEWTMVVDCKPSPVNDVAKDPATAERLWEASLAMVGEAGKVSEAVVGASRVSQKEEGAGKDEVKVEDLIGFETATTTMVEVPEAVKEVVKGGEKSMDVGGKVLEAQSKVEKAVEDAAEAVLTKTENKVEKGTEKLVDIGKEIEQATGVTANLAEAQSKVEKAIESTGIGAKLAEAQNKVEKATENLVGAGNIAEKPAEKLVAAQVSTAKPTDTGATATSLASQKIENKVTEFPTKLTNAPDVVTGVAKMSPPQTSLAGAGRVTEVKTRVDNSPAIDDRLRKGVAGAGKGVGGTPSRGRVEEEEDDDDDEGIVMSNNQSQFGNDIISQVEEEEEEEEESEDEDDEDEEEESEEEEEEEDEQRVDDKQELIKRNTKQPQK